MSGNDDDSKDVDFDDDGEDVDFGNYDDSEDVDFDDDDDTKVSLWVAMCKHQ
jgi:hypothetical protein